MWASLYLILLTVSTFLIELSVCRKIHIGPCVLVIDDKGDCPDPEYIQVYLFTRKNQDEGQYVVFSESFDNFSSSNFDPSHANKIIIHGYSSDMHLDALVNITQAYLHQNETNVWMVNYPKLVSGSLCYPFAVHNIAHVGRCLVQLVNSLRRHSATEIHVVGFSLGAHVPNYIANYLGDEKLDRITGLDPAGPLFTSRSERHRLDPSDANFVDVVHTNGLIQGIIERSGHVDFYMNGGISQPGCLGEYNPFNCDHHRAAQYFAESINTEVGFLGWKCEGYLQYLRGECKPSIQLLPMGDKCPSRSGGFYIAYTASDSPFALGNWTGDTYLQRAPKTSFTKINGNITNDLPATLDQDEKTLNGILQNVK